MEFTDPDAAPTAEEKQLAIDLHQASLKGMGMMLATARELMKLGWRKAPDPGPIPDGVVVLRKRRVEVHAMRWTGENADRIADWIQASGKAGGFHKIKERAFSPDGRLVTGSLWVEANSSWLPLENGEWILRDQHGFYPCKADLIEGPDATYDIVGGVA